MYLEAWRTGREEAKPIWNLQCARLDTVSSRGNSKVKRVELVVHDLTSEDAFGNREDVTEDFVEHFGDVLLMIYYSHVLTEI